VVSALADADTLIVSDAHNHASLIDACRLSRGQLTIVPHNDTAAVRGALAKRSQTRALVLVETIYSVLGDAAPVAALADVCAAHDALLVADEAHALGVAGAGGRGLLHDAGVADRPEVIATLTLSKSLGAQGGAVLSSHAVREHLVNRARPFIYDTGLAPAAAGGALAALAVVGAEPKRVERVNEIAATLAEACRVDAPAGAVLAVPMPGPLEALAAVEKAAGSYLRIGCFRPPSTPDGISRLRLTAHAQLDDSDVARAVGVLQDLL
jgi:8-amino-7-oxononanoate synthase